jgi:hypothetical protein
MIEASSTENHWYALASGKVPSITQGNPIESWGYGGFVSRG